MSAKFTVNTNYFPQKTWVWNLPSGYTCPFAYDCKTYADRETGKIITTHHTKFRCYAAVTERFPNVRKRAWENFESLKRLSQHQMTQVLLEALPEKATHVRIHVSGDFFSEHYFKAWLNVALEKPDVLFWTFTKSIPYLLEDEHNIPKNLIITASYGGTFDYLISDKMKSARL